MPQGHQKACENYWPIGVNPITYFYTPRPRLRVYKHASTPFWEPPSAIVAHPFVLLIASDNIYYVS